MPATVGGDGSESIFLARIEGSKATGVTLFTGTGPTVKTDTGYRPYKQCLRTGLLYLQIDLNEEFGRQQCWHINHNVNVAAGWGNKDQPNPLLKAGMGELGIRHVLTPDSFLAVLYRLAEKNGYLNTLYYFSPEADGIPEHRVSSWNDSDWHIDYINRYPDKVAYVARLKEWAINWWPRLKTSFTTPL
jgi:hypothetical protein